MSRSILSFDPLGTERAPEDTESTTSEWGRGVLDSMPYSEYSEDTFDATYSDTFNVGAPEYDASQDPTKEQTDNLSRIAQQRGTPVGGPEVKDRMAVGDFTTLDLGGSSEQLAVDEAKGGKSAPSGFAVPTDESLDAALDNTFQSMAPRLQGNPTFGNLEWEDPSSSTGGTGSSPQLLSNRKSVASFGVGSPAPQKDDYGWGIGHAFSRGLIRAGQLVDLAQGDVQEFSEGAEELKKYGVSEEDEKRLAELQETDGFWSAIGYYVTNPALAMQVVVESLPMSAPTLVGAAGGALLAGPAGAIAGGASGSGITEYLATIGDSLSEAGIDATDPAAVKAAFSDPEFMAEARKNAVQRGVGVAIFDGLSVGLAGRLYKPIKALAGASTKTGAVLGGTSELLAQSAAGAGGEGAAQIFDKGEVHDMPALAGEAIGEIVPGIGEIAINKMTGKDAAGNKPDDLTNVEKDVPDVKPDDTMPPTTIGGKVLEVPEDADVDAEGEDIIVEPPPETEPATTSPETVNETAPSSQEGAPSEVVEQVDVEDMLAAAQDKEDAADQAAKEAESTPEEVSPLIDTKALGPKVSATISAQEKPGPVRSAWRGLMETLATRYPDVAAKVPTRTFSGTGVAKFFKTLQDEVDITKDLPELKDFLDVITTGKPAEVIQALERLTSKVQASTPSLADAPIDSIAGQVQAAYNDFNEYYESHQRTSKAKRNKGQTVLKGSSINMANKLGELAGAVRQLLTAAYEAGVLEEAGIGAHYGKTLQIADDAAQAAQAPFEKKTKAGGKTKGIAFGKDTLFKNAQALKEIAEKVVPLLAEVEAKVTKAKETTHSKAKVAPTPAVTEAPVDTTSTSKPSTAPKPKPMGRAIVDASRVANLKESIRKLSAGPTNARTKKQIAAQEKLIAEIEAGTDRKAPKESGKLAGKERAQKIAFDKERKAEVEAAIVSTAKGDGGPLSLSRIIKGFLGGVDVNYATVVQLRKIAKHIGAKGYSKLTRAGVLRLVQEQANQNVEQDNAQGVAEEDAEVKADVEKHVPEKFRTGHVFHTIRSVKDIASIIKSGLKKGTNLALDIMGQGVSMLGDVGTTVLVFKDDKGAYTTKGYQNDGVAKGGMKPVAIITDETDAAVISELKKTGLPVYSNGKRNVTVTKKATKKATKKPDVEGANPDEVFDVTPRPTVGAKSREDAALLNEEGKGGLTRALAKVGMSKKGANLLNGIKDALGGEKSPAFKKLISAITEFVDTADGNPQAGLLRLLTQVDEIVKGKTVPPDVLEALTEYSLLLADARANRPVSTEEVQDSLYDDRLDMTEDERAIAEQTGAIEPRIDGDSTVVDEWNVPYAERLRTFVDTALTKLLPKRDRNRIRIDQAIVERALNKIRLQLDAVTRSHKTEDQYAEPDKMNMAEMIDLLLSALPANHRYTHLLKLLKGRNLRGVDIQLSDTRFSLDAYGKVAGLFTLGVDENGVTDPNSSKIELLYEKDKNADDFVRRMLHEMLHAATALKYYTDKLFANHVDALWVQAVEAYAKTDPTFSLEKFNEARESGGSNGVTKFMLSHLKSLDDGGFANRNYYGLVNSHEFMSESFTKPEFQNFLAGVQLQLVPGMLPPSRRRVSKFGSTISILSDFIKSVGDFLGVSTRNTVLEEIILSATANFDSNISYGFGKGRVKFAKKRPIQDKITAEERSKVESILQHPDNISQAELAFLQNVIDRDAALARKVVGEVPADALNTFAIIDEDTVNPYDGKYDSASLTKLVSQALKVKTRAKELLKAARAAQANIKKGASPLEVDAVVTKTGKAINRAKKAIELLSIGLEAADSGRRHVIQDHLERAEEHLSKVKTIKINVKEYDRGTGKVRVTARHEFFSPEYAKDKYLELRAAGLSMSFRGVDAETIRSWGPVEAPNTFAIIDEESIPDKKVRSTVVNDTADAARERHRKVKQAYESITDTIKNLPRAINLGFMNRDVIERNYRELFQRASTAAGHLISPLTQYIKAKQDSSRLAEKYALRANAALQKMQKLDNQTRSKVQAMMRDTTLAQVWPHLSLRDKMNAHLWTKPNKKGVSKLSPELGKAATKARKEWRALHKENPEAANLLIEMAMLTREIQDQKRIEALQAVGKTYEVDENIIKRLATLGSKADIQAMFPGMYDKDGDLISVSKDTRPADTIKDKNDSKEVKKAKDEKLKKWKDMRAIARTAEEIVKGTSINGPYFPLRRYGKYVVSSTEEYNEDNEPYVSFHATRAEARRVAAALKEKHKMPTYTTKKAESMVIARDVESVAGELASRMEGNKEGSMHLRMKAAMIEIMADNTAYASQLKRHGVDGVASDDMGRAFEEYVFVAKYTLGDLATSYEVTQSLKDLKKLQTTGMQDALRNGVTEDEAQLIGDVVNELAAQNREDAKDREMSGFQKGVGLIGFFNFLGAPSYWVLNATQTLTVTLPYIGAKWGGKKGSVAYYNAAGTVLKAAAGAKSYEQFKANLPDAALKVVEELERQGILQSTIAHQFGDMMTPSTLTSIQEWAGPVGKATATALKLMETIPEGVEKYNRISTALAIYSLSDGNITEVADGVQATQFNYDSANRARLMKAAPGWAGGGLRAVITPMMMFKSYGIGITRLLYGNMIRAAMGKTAAERSEARKLAGGLIVSHTVFGGVAGGLMMGPVQGLVSVFNQVFREAGDEFDPEEAVELYLQDVANDTVAALAARGVPAALGLDMSKSINLGNLIWMGNDRINLGDAGGVETALTTALGPVAQWGITSVREGARLWNGDPRGNWYDFAAAAVPLKMFRGTVRGAKYEFEGIGTDTLTFVEPDDVTGWIRSAMGFRPTSTAMTTDYEYNLMARDQRRSKRKSTLIDRALRADSATKRAAVWDDIDDFNRSLEKRSEWIRRGDVVRLKSSRRSRQRTYDRRR